MNVVIASLILFTKMYSRAERKFLTPNQDHANPKLGPGCYTPDDLGVFVSKSSHKSGYAPFSSLAPRVSYFNDLVSTGPAPGAYDALSALPFFRKASFFGRSKAIRFDSRYDEIPAPNSYVLPSSLRIKSTPGRTKPNGYKTVIHNPLAQQPLPAPITQTTDEHFPSPLESDAVQGDIKQSDESNEIMNAPQEENQEDVPQVPVQIKTKEPLNHNLTLIARHMEGLHSAPARTKSIPSQPKVIWKRKHIPPSIPVHNSVFGYQEAENGDLVPRKAPKIVKPNEPSHLNSFAELAKHNNKGYKFGKSSVRLTFRINQGPGPNMYDPSHADYYLKHAVQGPAVMGLSPCKRLTDEIVNTSLKKGVPGPGSYELKAPLAEKLAEKRNRITFGKEGHKGYLNPSQLQTPGPGSYYPEYSEHFKPHSQKTQSFGSTTLRFKHEKMKFKSHSMPAPGSYNNNEIDSIMHRVKKRAQLASTNPGIAFGSFSERFPRKQKTLDPAPGQYDPEDYQVQNGSQGLTKPETVSKPRENKINTLMKKGPAFHKIGELILDPSQVPLPVFGTQTKRFNEDSHSDIPPVGSYELQDAFQNLRIKGKLDKTGIMSSQSKREIFRVKERTPGPGEYDHELTLNGLSSKHLAGSFISSESRFIEKPIKVPGPGAYDVEKTESLIKKSFNITLTEYHQSLIKQKTPIVAVADE